MPVKVIDASAAAAILFNEPDADKVANEIGGHALAAPPLIMIEVANVCLKKIRAHPSLRESLFNSFRLLARLDIEIIEIDVAETISLADKAQLTIYDACYLWLARELACDLLTLDKKLRAATK
jgi:predicted nucleic acid-binding protein